MPIRMVIGCCNYLFAEGLRKLLKDESGINIIGVFKGGKNLESELKGILKLNPDIILSDYTPDFNILLNLPESFFQENRLRILLIGNRTLRFLADKHLKELISKGVVGILPPSADSDLLKKALKAVLSGELWLDRNTLKKLLVSMKKQEKNVNLARREREIVQHICQGYRNKEIAQKLNISEQTVKSHCNRIYRKLGVSDRLQLALYTCRIWPVSTRV
ncbi:MAG: response regulator transcription factor [Nitrospirae bacterium]|nr:response regulator transcription factor [Nitrospirota bacterium]